MRGGRVTTLFTFTEAMPEVASELVPVTVMVEVAVLVPVAGEVMATVGGVASSRAETVVLHGEVPALIDRRHPVIVGRAVTRFVKLDAGRGDGLTEQAEW